MIKLTESEIMSIVKSLGIQYTDHGDYIKFKCINPTHEDNNPSMTMIKSNGYTRCWSCGTVYNFSSFVKQASHKSISEFVDMNKYNRNFFTCLPKKDVIKKFEKNAERKLRILKGEMLEATHNKKVMEFLHSINVSEEAINFFNIQYVKEAEITFRPIDTKGTFLKNRVVIPIHENLKFINLECRDYTGKQTPKVLYPRGSKADVLFNYDNLDFNKPLIVVEGIKSALRIWHYITKNVTATLGSGLGKSQKQLISRMTDLILFPDHDTAGMSMISQVDNIMDYDYRIVLMSEEGQDPADGTLDDVHEALDNPIMSYDHWLNDHNLVTKPRRIKRWI